LRGGTSGVATRELRLHHRHGGYSWWSLAARRTNDHPAESDIVLALSSIDAEKRAELTIHEEQARRAAALESMFDPHVLLRAMTDINGKIVDFQYIDANAAACDYMDMSPEQLVGRTVLELLPAHDQTGLLQRYIDTLNTGHPLVLNDYEYPHEVLATRRLFDIRAVKVGDCLSFTWRDVTERNDAAQLLRDSEQRYRLLAEHIGDAVVSADPTGVIDFVSPSVELMLGWLPEELTGQRVVALVHPDDIEQAAAASVALRAGQPTASGRVRLRHKDGGWKWMASVTRAVHNEAGEIASTISTWRDIQAEVEAEERLTASERRFRLLAEHSLDIVATLTLDGRIEWISPSAEQVLGWSPAETVGRRYLDLIDPQDRRWFDEEVRRLATMGEPSRLTVRVLRANADSLWMEAVGQQSTDPATGESMRVVRLRDVQDAHVAHEVLQRQRARLSETVNGVADPLMLLDPVFDDSRVVDFLVEEVNNAACRYLRLDRAELVGAHL
jgi:PAS domain S-box-containing protein